MTKILNTEQRDTALREVNTDSFLQRLNQELMNSDPTVAIQLGIKVEHRDKGQAVTQTPEELAAQEAEREKMLQESMQQEVVNVVLKKLQQQMDAFDA